MRTLYFDCFAGASGNMILGALIAAGVDPGRLRSELGKLDLPAFELEIETVDRSGISSTHVNVRVPEENGHRHLSDIRQIIERSTLSEKVRSRAIAVFTRLAEAEARVHGIEVERVHFHEVGAMDAIVDIVGACIGFELLGVESFACSRIHVGNGFVDMAHGKFPVPPPAVTELLKGFGSYATEIEGELITPTGAAIITTVCGENGAMPTMTPDLVGYGAGSRKFDGFPNVLRVIIGEAEVASTGSGVNSTPLVLIETNIDDISPQVLGYVMERAFEIGAKDCWFTPIQMKKDRPATMVTMLCDPASKDKMIDLLYRETTTIGVRVQQIERECLERTIVYVETKYGNIDVKLAIRNGEVVNAMPEYDHVRRAAIAHDVPFLEVQNEALRVASLSATVSGASA